MVKSTTAPPRRADALDALRGFAVLAMVLSGVIPRQVLPAWMYHAQVPPPIHTFNPDLPGLTWVDLVFPLFLFSMGAAIPLALSRRLAKGWGKIKIILSILKRGFLLGVFAIFLQHIRPFSLSQKPTPQTWTVALLGFFILFLMFVRWSKSWVPWLRRVMTLGGWVVGVIFLWQLSNSDVIEFSWERSDIILIVLTNIAVFSSIIWLFSQSNWWLRLGLLGCLLALRLSSNSEGWIAQLWSTSPVPWIFRFDYLKYLFIAIPGTIAGDLINSWLKSIYLEEIEKNSWKNYRFFSIFILTITILLTLLTGLQARWIWETTLISLALCLGGLFLLKNPSSATEKLIHYLYKFGIYWIIIGLLFEPYEGGIKKDPSTVSYYFISTGLAILLLINFTIIINVFQKKSWLQLLIDNGMNPMIAYTGFANLVWPILALSNLDQVIEEMTSTPIKGFFRGLAYTLVVAFIVSFLTKKKIFWRT
ncbi:DUF5009 domain-containing protein [Lyngbya aestuarii]|uniref:DUF5009 domain-containing protein n=1 Tax=Lyngbya aestuarii TaxID=118322 RepID=UPI00403E08A4